MKTVSERKLRRWIQQWYDCPEAGERHKGILAPGHLGKWRKPGMERARVRMHLAGGQQPYQGPFLVTYQWGLHDSKCWLGQNLLAPGDKIWRKQWRWCEAQSNESAERLIAAVPEIWKPRFFFVNSNCINADEWGKERADQSWKKGGSWRAPRSLEWRESCDLLLPLVLPVLPALPAEISEPIRKDLEAQKMCLRKTMEWTFWISMLCSWSHLILIFASEEKNLGGKKWTGLF